MEKKMILINNYSRQVMYKNTLFDLTDYPIVIKIYVKMKNQKQPRITMKFSNNNKLKLDLSSTLNQQLNHKQQIHSVQQRYQLRIKQFKILKDNLHQLMKHNKLGIGRQLPLINRKTRQFITERHQYKFLQKYIVAESFCKHGYGAQAVLQFIKYYKDIVVNPKNYENIVKSIVSEAISKLQQFIIQECKIQITKIGLNDLSPVYNRLLNCRTQLRRQDCQIFLGLIKVQYGIYSMTISEVSGLRLYIEIRQLMINSKKMTKSSTSFYPQNKLTNHMQKKMIFNSSFRPTPILNMKQAQANKQIMMRIQNKQSDKSQKNGSKEEKYLMLSQYHGQDDFYDILDKDLDLQFDENTVQDWGEGVADDVYLLIND